MYWNVRTWFMVQFFHAINYNMRCIETQENLWIRTRSQMINYNMRCIETIDRAIDEMKRRDKLQHEMYWNRSMELKPMTMILINYNMRCIETTEEGKPKIRVFIDKLQHEMYWNHIRNSNRIKEIYDKLQHEMYWNVAAT